MEKEGTGRVYLVGAGPSDPGLMTLKGKAVLEKAEVVVYDALIGQEILTMIPDGAEAVNVGKRASHHTLPQEEISELLVQKAKEGKTVVRLKGGDPFLFGRGGEEIELLVRENIPFEVVPGVTSAVSVPAYEGIPVTHRDYCSSVHIITGHKREGMDYDIDFDALVRTRGTLIFLMGVTALPEICQALLKAGMSPDTPAALLMRGTTAAQRRIVATVQTLEEEVRQKGSCTPAIIVVGGVCSLADQFAWYEKLPLGGVKVLLTRPKELISETAEKLREKGAEVLEIPAIRTERIPDNERFAQALGELSSYQWIVFTSRNGVRIFFEEMRARRIDSRALGAAKFAVIGSGTRKELENHGFFADLVPDVFDALHLGKALAETCRDGDRILIPRALKGSPDLTAGLSERFVPDDLPIYETKPAANCRIDLRREFESGSIDDVLFTSASAVRGLKTLIGEDRDFDYSKIQAVCIGPQTAAEAEAAGMKTSVAGQADIDSLVECLCERHRKAL